MRHVCRTRASLRSDALGGVSLRVRRTSRSGIDACAVEVAEATPQPPRDFAAIDALLAAAEGRGEGDPRLPAAAARAARRAFLRLARAEAAVHGVADPRDVHFHEVGCADSIADTVCACAMMEYLCVERVVPSPLPIGRRVIHGAAHGPLPNPPPATLALVRGPWWGCMTL